MELDRITLDSDILGGKPCIRGMQISVSLIINLVADGMSRPEILEAYPDLEDEDIAQALKYAALACDQMAGQSSDHLDPASATQRATEIRERFKGHQLDDSTDMIREDRE